MGVTIPALKIGAAGMDVEPRSASSAAKGRVEREREMFMLGRRRRLRFLRGKITRKY
jgi:hypothetical protein